MDKYNKKRNKILITILLNIVPLVDEFQSIPIVSPSESVSQPLLPPHSSNTNSYENEKIIKMRSKPNHLHIKIMFNPPSTTFLTVINYLQHQLCNFSKTHTAISEGAIQSLPSR